MNQKELQEKSEAYLKKILSKVLNLSPDKLLAHEPFEKYGIDSIMIVNLNRALEKVFGDLPKTLFFEYQTLQALTEYFINNHFAVLAKKILREPETSMPVDESIV